MHMKVLSILAAVLITIGAVFVVSAQQAGTAPPSFKAIDVSLVDSLGVDRHKGTLTTSHKISIGTPDAGMTYTLPYSSGGQAWSPENYYRGNITQITEEQSQDRTGVSYLGIYEVFDAGGRGDLGSSFSFIGGLDCLLRTKDGTKIGFRSFDSCTGGRLSQGMNNGAQIVYVQKPDGERLDFYYNLPPNGLYSLSSVVSSYGYQLRFSYQFSSTGLITSGSATLINMAVDPCSPTVSTCEPFTVNWPKLTWTYEGMNYRKISSITNSLNETYTYSYFNTGGAFPVISSVTKPSGASVSYQWTGPTCSIWAGGQGDDCRVPRLTAVNDNGKLWQYGSGTSGPLSGALTRTDPSGVQDGWWVDEYDDGRYRLLVKSSDAFGRVTTYSYFLNQRHLQKIVHPEGNSIYYEYEYDGYYNITRIDQNPKPNSGGQTRSTFITYAAGTNCLFQNPGGCDKPLTVRDERGYVTRYTWSSSTGQLTSVEKGLTGPDTNLSCSLGQGKCPITNMSYGTFNAYYRLDLGGSLVAGPATSLKTLETSCVTSSPCSASDRIDLSFGYGPANTANNLAAQTISSGGNNIVATTTYSYDAVGNVVQVDGPRNDVDDTQYALWDPLRRKTFDIGVDPDGGGLRLRKTTRQVFNIDGLLITEQVGTSNSTSAAGFNAVETTNHTYDTSQRRVKTVNPSGVIQYSYDGADRLICTALRMNPNAYAALPADACQLSTQGSEGPDRIARNTYDAAGQLREIMKGFGTPLQQVYSSMAYTPNGKRDWIKDANNNLTDLAYDGHDRLSAMYFPSTATGSGSANYSDSEQYAYDSANNRIITRKRDGQFVTSTYDGLNRETVRDYNGETKDVYTSYDLISRKKEIRHDSFNGPGLSYIYDSLGRVTGEISFGQWVWSGYDLAGNRTAMAIPDGNYILYSYDATGKVNDINENGAASGLGLLASYTYDNLGRVTQLTRGNGTVTNYTYDGASRLQSLSNNLAGEAYDNGQGLGYNPASQIRSSTNSNAQYRPSSTNYSESYVRDGLNRYTSVASAAFTYDGRSNLTSDGSRTFAYDLENRLVSVGGGATLLASYDPVGRLLTTTSNGQTVQYLYDGDQLVGEYGSGGLARRYVHGAKADDPLVWYEGGDLNDRRWLHANHQGSIVAVSDMSGNISGSPMRYGSFGEPDAVTGWGGSRFRYTGQITLPGVGLYHYKARVYDPKLGRFLQTDPIGYEDGMNMYAYVGNDPWNGVDPTGTQVSLNSRGWNLRNLSPEQRQQAAQETEQAFDFVSIIAPQLRAVRPAIATARAFIRGAPRQAARTCCFIAGTKIQTKDGLRPIESLKVGDLVLSKDETQGTIAWKPITELVRRHQREIWEVRFAHGSSRQTTILAPEVFGTTDDHPWRTEAGTWARTDELRPGMRIQRAAGTLAIVQSVVKTDRLENTFNLEVADFHTYFVGELSVWVHNACTYRVPGDRTGSGRPYIGQTGRSDPSKRAGNGRDGREREAGDVTTEMPSSSATERRIQEQKELNEAGGVNSTDNKVNPVSPRLWKKHGIDPPTE